jgi:uncharacterized membrane protein YvbJ
VSCPNCGDPIDENQKFCEKCGFELRSVKSPPKTDEKISLTTLPKQTPLGSANLFDLNRNYYIIKEKISPKVVRRVY